MPPVQAAIVVAAMEAIASLRAAAQRPYRAAEKMRSNARRDSPFMSVIPYRLASVVNRALRLFFLCAERSATRGPSQFNSSESRRRTSSSGVRDKQEFSVQMARIGQHRVAWTLIHFELCCSAPDGVEKLVTERGSFQNAIVSSED